MATREGKKDKHVRAIHDALSRAYGAGHPRARIDVKRYNSVSVRVRVVDPGFAGQSWAERDDAIWDILDTLPETTRAEVSLLNLLTPAEAKTSLMNVEFDDPTPSSL